MSRRFRQILEILVEPALPPAQGSISLSRLDYWPELEVVRYINWEDFLVKNPQAKIYMATTKGRHVYTDVSYEPDCYLMFGKESAGIPEEILKEHPDTCVRIPMIGETRSLNLSNSAAIILYEALRQNDFQEMKLQGELHHLNWDEVETLNLLRLEN